MTFISILATFFGIAMSVAAIPQAYKIFRRKHADDISVITYLIYTIGSFIWVIYGISIHDLPIIITYPMGTISSGLVLIGYYKYRKK